MLHALLWLSAALGAIAGSVPAGHAYQPPGPGDVRSPCPGLNSLANHAFINHDGKNITVPQLVAAGMPGLGIGPDFMTTIGALALFSPAVPDLVSFDLNDLDEHNFPIEHDVSLTRQDYYFHHDDSTFQQPLFNSFINHFKGDTMTSLKTSAAARYARVRNSLKNNPHVTYGPMQFIFSYGESGLYTQTMGQSPLALAAPVAYVSSLFQEERLPYELGWEPSTVPITLPTLGNFAFEMFSVQKERLPEGIEILTRGSYKEFVTTRLAIEAKLHNVTVAHLTGGKLL